jgi:heme/copper-type cytochrome/quinol oxidase subunit 3
MWLFILLIGIALSLFVLSYFYLRIEAEQWPLDGLPLPTLTWVGLGTLFVLLNVVILRWSRKQLEHNRMSLLKTGLAMALLSEVAAVGLLVFDLTQLSFDWQANAYGSIFWSLGAFVILFFLVGIGMNLFTQFWTWRGIYDSERPVAMENTALYWSAMLVVWLVAIGVAYVVPYRF